MSEPMFRKFGFKNKVFLAVETDRNSTHIIDCEGNSYGAWRSMEAFLKYAKKDEQYLEPIGKIRLLVAVVAPRNKSEE